MQSVDVNGPSAPYTVVNIEHPAKDEIEMWVKRYEKGQMSRPIHKLVSECFECLLALSLAFFCLLFCFCAFFFCFGALVPSLMLYVVGLIGSMIDWLVGWLVGWLI